MKTPTAPTFAILAATALSLGACTTTGNIERNTAGGAALGAAAGAAIGNNVGEGDAQLGAAIGGVVGGAVGAERGRRQDRAEGGTERRRYGDGRYTAEVPDRRYYDEAAGRYYIVRSGTSDTYWEDGTLRSRGY